MLSKKTIVLGASSNPERYSFLAVRQLIAKQHEVIALGNKAGNIDELMIRTDLPEVDAVDTISLYLNPNNQKPYYAYILALKPKRIIFNPGTENDELATAARTAGIEPIEACTLVLLATGQY
jgi:predicted CoA-binding protein